MNQDNKQIILIGFMGTGKSVVSEALADKLGINLIETDAEIIKREQMSISDIFEKFGEEYFRKCETELLLDLIKGNRPAIISTGGGIVLSDVNRRVMLDSYVVLLEATPEEIVKRVGKAEERPLLSDSTDMLKKIKMLLEQRKDFYEEVCDLKINTDNKTVEEITEEIMLKIPS